MRHSKGKEMHSEMSDAIFKEDEDGRERVIEDERVSIQGAQPQGDDQVDNQQGCCDGDCRFLANLSHNSKRAT